MSSKAVPLDGLNSIDPWIYRRTCAQFATGITVVTTLDSEGRPHGMTVNSFSSVSLDPPLVLVSIDLRNAILGHFISSSWFAINVLAEHQEDLSPPVLQPNGGKSIPRNGGSAGMRAPPVRLCSTECWRIWSAQW